MGNFLGGSAYAMAGQIAEGYILVTPVILKRLTRSDLGKLQFELERVLMEERSNQPPQEDVKALQLRNRKISRISNSLQVIKGQLSGR